MNQAGTSPDPRSLKLNVPIPSVSPYTRHGSPQRGTPQTPGPGSGRGLLQSQHGDWCHSPSTRLTGI
jgi:hypothetical protein